MDRRSVIPEVKRASDGLNECDHLELHERDGVVFMTAPLLDREKWLVHAFSTRLGGVSTGETASMNLSFAREENRENVRENYRRFLKAAGIQEEGLVLTWQTHTNTIRTVTSEDAGKGLLRERDYKDVDGLVTNIPGMSLAVFMSDCVPVFAADPVHHAVGAAHSGWRGTVTDIGGELIRRMQSEYGSRPEDILCVIGPSICRSCYEVTGEVIDRFRDAYDEKYWQELFVRTDDIHYQLDLRAACRRNFLLAGVLPEQISVTDICTRCNPQLLYSHRLQHGKQGNLAGMIGIKN